jgi:acetolactate synthase-1/2/3 large subunit
MNGADVVVRTLLSQGVDLCLANPGTSEMHFLAAVDANPGMRAVLALQENVATGAADGYARLTGRPAATLLHLGPGLANGLSNLHNAARALSPVVNIVGDHAMDHHSYDAPLTSDIEGLSRTFSVSTRTISPGRGAAAQIEGAVADSLGIKPGVATVLLPADSAWSPADLPDTIAARAVRPETGIDPLAVRAAVDALCQPGAVLLLGYGGTRGQALVDAGRIAARTGAQLMAQTASPVTDRGAGTPALERLPYPLDLATARLAKVPVIVLAGSKAPVAFFAYPGKKSKLYAPHTHLLELSRPQDDTAAYLAAVAEECGAAPVAKPAGGAIPQIPTDRFDAAAVGAVLARLLPENCIFVDEGLTNGLPIFTATAHAAPHRWLQNMGGSIGFAAPMTIGCALAEKGTPVIAMIGDGSAMYTLQSLWTQAREQLHVVTLILANRTYNILKGEVRNLDLRNRGAAIQDMLSIDNPLLDFVKLAEGMGVPARRVDSTTGLQDALTTALKTKGPSLIEVTL